MAETFTVYRSNFSKIKRKLEDLERKVINFKGDDPAWQMIEVWKPLAFEIANDLEEILGKIETKTLQLT